MTTFESLTLPTLDQLRKWDVHHLELAADAWSSRADSWEAAYGSIFREISRAPWEGDAAEAAARGVAADRLVVLDCVDRMNGVADVARAGAADIRTAKRRALEKITAARDAGFDVERDLSITVTSSYGQRQAQAVRLAQSIWRAATALVVADARVADEITGAAAKLGDLRFSMVSAERT